MKLILGDCIEKMKDIPDNSIDMVMTSPPYDNLRHYGKDFTGWGEHIWKPVLDGIFRVLKDGGVCVWVVADATINGSETGTSFKQALYWMEIGGNLHDTMIWNKKDYIPLTHNRYEQSFEYMFIFSKGKPKTFHPIKIESLTAGTTRKRKCSNKEEGSAVRNRDEITVVQSTKIKNNVWLMPTVSNKINHPAQFPEQLAKDHILSWSNENDTILDPFMGSGTTGIACIDLNRDFIGIELDEGYFKIAKDRIRDAQSQGVLL